jgi:hypothetical protein
MSIASGFSDMIVAIMTTNSANLIGRCLDTSRRSTSISATPITFPCQDLCLFQQSFIACAALHNPRFGMAGGQDRTVFGNSPFANSHDGIERGVACCFNQRQFAVATGRSARASSCPGLTRASLTFLSAMSQHVDGRDKPGHDVAGLIAELPGRLLQRIRTFKH